MKRLVVVLFVVSLWGPATASAHMPVRSCSALPPKQELRCGQRAYFHGLGVVRFYTRALAAHRVDAKSIRIVRDHRWLMRQGRAWIVDARKRMQPVIAHLALWNCIHNGASPTAPHEGNSSSGTYTGPLQMTYPWMGHYERWYYLPIATVYSIAEQEYREQGYSRAWLFGQWPLTAPPCSGFA